MRIIERFRSLTKSLPSRPRSSFRASALKGKVSPLPASVVLESWEIENVSEPEIEEQQEPPFGEIAPGSIDLRRYLTDR
jgi:hypothetical protein